MTSHGLFSLVESLPPSSLSVLFRGNHFAVLLKRGGGSTGISEELFTLVTDAGYAKTPEIVWESLSTLEGDSVFVNGNFKKYEAKETSGSIFPFYNQTPQNDFDADTDLALAMSLQEQENSRFGALSLSDETPPAASPIPGNRNQQAQKHLEGKDEAKCSLM